MDERQAARLVAVSRLLSSRVSGAVCAVHADGNILCAARDGWGNLQRVIVPPSAGMDRLRVVADALRVRTETGRAAGRKA